MFRVFVTHNPEDQAAYHGRSLPRLSEMADVALNAGDRDLTMPGIIDAAADVHVIVAHRSPPGEPELRAGRLEGVASMRTAIDISTVDVDAAGLAVNPDSAPGHRPYWSAHG